jgi:thioredoxin 1
MNQIRHFDEAGFEAQVLGSEQPVLVDFYADWCGPCRMMGPVVERLAGEYDGRLIVGKLDVDSSPTVAMKYSIMSIPTLGLYVGGNLVDRLVGFPGPSGIKAWVEGALAKSIAA